MGASGSSGVGNGLRGGELTGEETLSTGDDDSVSTVGDWPLSGKMLVSPFGRMCLRLRKRVIPSVISTTDELGDLLASLTMPGFHVLLRWSKTRTGSFG